MQFVTVITVLPLTVKEFELRDVITPFPERIVAPVGPTHDAGTPGPNTETPDFPPALAELLIVPVELVENTPWGVT